MVGDDLVSDVLGAQAVGITGVLARTGKFRRSDLDQVAETPDHVIDDVGELPELVTQLSDVGQPGRTGASRVGSSTGPADDRPGTVGSRGRRPSSASTRARLGPVGVWLGVLDAASVADERAAAAEHRGRWGTARSSSASGSAARMPWPIRPSCWRPPTAS